MNKDSKKKKGKINIKFVTFENNGTYDIYCLNTLVLIIGEYSPKFSLPGFVTENEFCPQKMQKMLLTSPKIPYKIATPQKIPDKISIPENTNQ